MQIKPEKSQNGVSRYYIVYIQCTIYMAHSRAFLRVTLYSRIRLIADVARAELFQKIIKLVIPVVFCNGITTQGYKGISVPRRNLIILFRTAVQSYVAVNTITPLDKLAVSTHCTLTTTLLNKLRCLQASLLQLLYFVFIRKKRTKIKLILFINV